MRSRFFTQFAARYRTKPFVRAIGLMLISTTAFSGMNIAVRAASQELPSGTLMMLRNILTLGLLMPLVLLQGMALLRTRRLRAHITRSMIGAVGMLTWIYALTIMPINQATALSFTAPLFAILFAVLFLGEKADGARWLGMLVGFGGTLIILNPIGTAFDWRAVMVIAAASLWAVTSILVKSLSNTEPPLRMVFYMNLFMFLFALPIGLTHWQWPTAHGWMLLLVIASCSLIMHFTLATAYGLVPVVTLLPLDFLRLIITAILAYFFFGETSHINTWIGATIIITSAVALARRDAKAVSLPIEEG